MTVLVQSAKSAAFCRTARAVTNSIFGSKFAGSGARRDASRGARFLFLLTLVLLLAATPWGTCLAWSQIDIDEVHVKPQREVAGTSRAGGELIDPSLKTQTKPFKASADLVLVPVTIMDPMSRLVVGLAKGNFTVFEDKKRQEIKHFSTEDAPVSLGVILDLSGSMSSKLERAREAVLEFFKTANPQDEFFMITFASEPREAVDFTQSVEDIQAQLLFTFPKGRTALFDAIYMGIAKMRKAKYARKALLIISDGGDNHSRYTEREITSVVKEADVLLYAIGIYDRYFQSQEESLGPDLLGKIAELTGGRAFAIDNPNDLPAVTEHLGRELRNQYVIGYQPQNAVRNGKWRKIKVKLMAPKEFPLLQIYAKRGYFAPSE